MAATPPPSSKGPKKPDSPATTTRPDATGYSGFTMSEHRERLPSPPMRPRAPVDYRRPNYRRGAAPLAGLAVVIAVIAVIAYAEGSTTTAIALVALTVLLAALVVFLRRR